MILYTVIQEYYKINYALGATGNNNIVLYYIIRKIDISLLIPNSQYLWSHSLYNWQYGNLLLYNMQFVHRICTKIMYADAT